MANNDEASRWQTVGILLHFRMSLTCGGSSHFVSDLKFIDNKRLS